MPDESTIPLLDHELAEDELAWMKAVYQDFGKIRASFAGREKEFNPKQALREVLAREEYRLQPRWTCRDPVPGVSARTAMAAASPRCSCQEWSCINTREAEPTSFPSMWSARRMRFPSARMHGPC